MSTHFLMLINTLTNNVPFSQPVCLPQCACDLIADAAVAFDLQSPPQGQSLKRQLVLEDMVLILILHFHFYLKKL